MKVFPGIQMLRACAVFSVLLYHFSHYSQSRLGIHLLDSPYWVYGSFGVQLFFVISGFVLWKPEKGALIFLRHRILRIYPGFFLAVCIALMLGNTTLSIALPALSLLPRGVIDYPLWVEWTLVYEVFFYMVLAAMALLPEKIRVWMPAAWFCLLAFCAFALRADVTYFNTMVELLMPTFALIWAASYGLPFVLGMMARQLSGVVTRKHFTALAVVFVLSMGAVLAIGPDEAREVVCVRNLLLGVAFSCLILVAAKVDFRMNRLQRAFKKTGDWSYGMYLLHVSVINALFTYFAGYKGNELVFLCFALLTVAAGCLLFGALENRLYTLLRRLDRR